MTWLLKTYSRHELSEPEYEELLVYTEYQLRLLTGLEDDDDWEEYKDEGYYKDGNYEYEWTEE